MPQEYISTKEEIENIATELFFIEYGVMDTEDHPGWPKAILEARKLAAAFKMMRHYEDKS